MPEGHTLHRLARLHTEYYAGGPVRVSSPQGRFVDNVVVDGRYFEHATATGKHLFHHYEGGLAVHIHLGLYGFFDGLFGGGDGDGGGLFDMDFDF